MDRYVLTYAALALVHIATAAILLFAGDLSLAFCALACAMLYALQSRFRIVGSRVPKNLGH